MRLQVFERRFGNSCAAELVERMREERGRIEGRQHTTAPVLRL